MNIRVDWFSIIKMDVIKLVLELRAIRGKFIRMIIRNSWIIEDEELKIILNRLHRELENSTLDLDELISEIDKIEEEAIFFDVEDLKDEITLIRENAHLQRKFIDEINCYIRLLDNPRITLDEIIKQGTEFTEQEQEIFIEMKSNDQLLKQLRKERREDYFE